MIRCLFTMLAVGAIGLGTAEPEEEPPFTIRVVDESTGRGVPLVELRTVHQQRYFTDSTGVVTIDDPELIGRDVFFHVSSHGYEFEEDGFGYRGARLTVGAGFSETLKLKRLNLAERLYRVTGAGIYDHSIRASLVPPIEKPLLNSQVFGCDSVLNAVYRGKLFWFWGDTNRARYPLGNFHTTGAVSLLPEDGGLDPDLGVDLDYFTGDKGFVKPVAKMPGDGPTWLSGLTVLPDRAGKDHLVAFYVKVKPPLTVYEKGLCEWDDEAEEFRKVLVFPEGVEIVPNGHSVPVRSKDGEAIYYADPLPTMRIADQYEAWKDPSRYEVVESTEHFRDAEGDRVKPHRGSIAWNGYRKKWVMIFCQTGGTPSNLGEIWYAEADAPEGPWEQCVKVVSHERYSFYNPKQHPYFAREEGRFIYFEGTYTAMFSKAPFKTPKYDYNQIMYRLDLSDERLKPAQSD